MHGSALRNCCRERPPHLAANNCRGGVAKVIVAHCAPNAVVLHLHTPRRGVCAVAVHQPHRGCTGAGGGGSYGSANCSMHLWRTSPLPICSRPANKLLGTSQCRPCSLTLGRLGDSREVGGHKLCGRHHVLLQQRACRQVSHHDGCVRRPQASAAAAAEQRRQLSEQRLGCAGMAGRLSPHSRHT